MSSSSRHICLVTGAGSGLGKALAEALAQRGDTVYLADVDYEGAQSASQAIQAAGGNAHAVALDVSQADAVHDVVNTIVTECGQLDLIINNAGYSVSGEVQHISTGDWQKITAVNFLGVVYGSQAAYAVMRSQGSGQIVNIASVYGLVSAPVSAAYVATKHAVVGFTRSLRYEAEAFGVQVNTVCPGFIATQLFENARYVGSDKDVMLKQLNVPLMPADKAAAKILRGMDRNPDVISFPWYVSLYKWLDHNAPFVLRFIYRKALIQHRALAKSSDETSHTSPT